MKKIMLVCVLICATVLIGIKISGGHEEHGCGPDSDRWEEIKECVDFSRSACLDDPETGYLKYYGPNTLDENENTAWCVGEGNIPGADILYSLFGLGVSDKVYGIEILPGYAKSDKLFKMNNRPKKILIDIICVESRLNSRGIITHSKEIVLKDERGYQKFMFNGKNTSEIIKEYCVKNGFKDYAGNNLRLTILEVYKGSKYDDTCISEIRFLDKKGKPMKLFPGMK